MKKLAQSFLLCLLVFSNLVQAQTPVATAFAFERFMLAAKASGWTTGANALGQTVATGPASLTRAASAAATVTPLASGGATVALAVGGGAAGAVSVASEAVLTGASVFALFKAIAGGPVGVGLTALMAAPAVIEWLAESGVKSNPVTSGGFLKSDPEVCTVAPCYQYFFSIPSLVDQNFSSASAACTSAASQFSDPGGWTYSGSVRSGFCYLSGTYPGAGPRPDYYSFSLSSRSVSPSPSSWQPATIEEIRLGMESIPVKKHLIDALLQAAQDGPEPKPSLLLTSPKNVTVSPSSVSDASVVTVTNADGKTTTKTETKTTVLTPSTGVDAQGRQVPTVTATTRVDTTVKVVDDATGAVLSESTTVTGTPTNPSEPAPEIETCGLPGKPKCLIDETGTPEVVEADVYKPKLDDYKTKQAELKDKVSGMDDKSFFSGWSGIFVTPPLAACTGYILPRDMGTIDPCPVVDGVRTIMAYIWALTALFLAVGMVKKVV